MERRRSIYRFFFSTLIVFIFILIGVEAKTIKRSCHACYKVIFPNYIQPQIITIGHFTARRGCGASVPDRCRRRARRSAHSCMKAHWESRSLPKAPPECCCGPIKGYVISKLDDYIHAEVYDYLSWIGSLPKDSITVEIHALTTGYSGCKKEVTLTKRYSVHFDRIKNIPNLLGGAVQKKVILIQKKNGPIKRILKTVKKAPGVYDYTLFYSAEDADKNRIAGVYNHKGDNKYVGCGIKVAQNVLAYFGIKKSQRAISHYIKSYKIGKNIAVYPSDLRKGLEKILADNGIENIKVDRYSGMSQADIETYLKQGFPVIALVDGGNHWVAITGKKASKISEDRQQNLYYVLDNWKNTVRSWYDLKLKFDERGKAWYHISNTSYIPGTIIVFQKKE